MKTWTDTDPPPMGVHKAPQVKKKKKEQTPTDYNEAQKWKRQRLITKEVQLAWRLRDFCKMYPNMPSGEEKDNIPSLIDACKDWLTRQSEMTLNNNELIDQLHDEFVMCERYKVEGDRATHISDDGRTNYRSLSIFEHKPFREE